MCHDGGAGFPEVFGDLMAVAPEAGAWMRIIPHVCGKYREAGLSGVAMHRP